MKVFISMTKPRRILRVLDTVSTIFSSMVRRASSIGWRLFSLRAVVGVLITVQEGSIWSCEVAECGEPGTTVARGSISPPSLSWTIGRVVELEEDVRLRLEYRAMGPTPASTETLRESLMIRPEWVGSSPISFEDMARNLARV